MSESSLKRWADEGRLDVSRTAGGHRRITAAEAIRFIRQSGLPLVDPRPLGISDLNDVPRDHLSRAASVDQPLIEAMMAGHAVLARGLVVAMYLGGRSICEICDGPLTRVMHQVGDLWKHSKEGILIEHRATDICAQALHQLRSLLSPPPTQAPLATGGTPAGDPYLLTSLMASLVLAAEGWREENLGPDVPLDLIGDAARERGAALVWLSVCCEQPSSKLADQILALGKSLSGMQCSLTVGGRMLPPRPMLTSDHVNIISSMSELAAFARGIRAARSQNN